MTLLTPILSSSAAAATSPSSFGQLFSNKELLFTIRGGKFPFQDFFSSNKKYKLKKNKKTKKDTKGTKKQTNDENEEEETNEETNKETDKEKAKQPKETPKETTDSEGNWTELFTDRRQLGATLSMLGFAMLIAGATLMFDAKLLQLGNCLFFIGLSLLIGPKNLFSTLSQRNLLLTTSFTLLGIILIIVNKPRIGLAVEIVGLLGIISSLASNLFGMIGGGERINQLKNLMKMFQPMSATNNFQF